MSALRVIKQFLGMSGTPANNFVLDASAANGTMKLTRESGVDIMTVDAAGITKFPQNPKNHIAQLILNMAGVIVPYNTHTILTTGHTPSTYTDPDNICTQTGAKITPKVAGWYLCRWQAGAGAVGVTYAEASIWKNGARVNGHGVSYPTNVGYLSATCTYIVYCNGTTDYLQVGIRVANQAGSGNTDLTDSGANLSAILIREA